MVFFFKLLLVLLLLFIIANLAKAMIEMVKGPSESEDDKDSSQPPMSHYLGRRVVLSALAVILMIVALLSGFIDPNSRPY
ncbi:DUF2909 domain-containing protein [Vibrio taketomensis]|uniref:DUF2909 domain-containing protein n=1 Tax=Vibrio taketomensis TaxID=2572923 RepID=UPI00138A0FB8|nr:DUF2909 domain-containing protein [Vibrio taketomensis]